MPRGPLTRYCHSALATWAWFAPAVPCAHLIPKLLEASGAPQLRSIPAEPSQLAWTQHYLPSPPAHPLLCGLFPLLFAGSLGSCWFEIHLLLLQGTGLPLAGGTLVMVDCGKVEGESSAACTVTALRFAWLCALTLSLQCGATARRCPSP